GSFLGLLLDSVPRPARSTVAGVLAGAVLVAGAGRALDVVAEPPPRGVWPNCPPCIEETKPVIREVEKLANREPVYLIWRMRPSWWFYEAYRAGTRPHDLPGDLDPTQVFIGGEPTWRPDSVTGMAPRTGPAWAHAEAARIAAIARPNVWLVSSHVS